MEKFILFLSKVPMVIIGGVALLISLILHLTDTHFAPNPAWIAVLICGLPLLYWAIWSLVKEKRITSALLITIAMLSCICIGELFAAGEVAFIMALGELLEEAAVNRSRRGISQLMALAPDTARLIVGNTEQTVAVEKIEQGNIVRVLPGEKITIDGRIVSGTTTVDQSIITGESLPVDKGIGDSVFCGTLNCQGSVDIEATSAGTDTSLQKMISLVQEAESKKAPTQRIIDKWAAWLVPIALVIALLTWLITGEMERGVTVMVVFCPCALALATPVSIIAGIGQATKFGVLVKSGEALEIMGKVGTIMLDKTGTITKGRLAVNSILVFDKNISEKNLLLWAASAEARSEHPIGKAIVAACRETLLPPTDFTTNAGEGITATIEGKSISCGKVDFLLKGGINVPPAALNEIEKASEKGHAVVAVAVGNETVGIITLSDLVREETASVMNELHGMGVETVMLTGDNPQAALHIAKQVGITQVRANLLPTDKVAAVKEERKKGRLVCMIGDGVNDAPALKTANVSVAMGAIGSDIAIESADIALMSDDIARLPYLRRLSKAVIKSIKLNISLSMLINFIAVTLSVLGMLTPVWGALVHNLGSVLVVLNAALLYDRKV